MGHTHSIDPLKIRRRLGREIYGVPTPFGPDGWYLPHKHEGGGVLVSAGPSPDQEDGDDWLHASISFSGRMPTYDELVNLHKAVWPDGYAYQVFAPPAQHVNIHPNALHLWGRLDGKPVMPEFGILGTI